MFWNHNNTLYPYCNNNQYYIILSTFYSIVMVILLYVQVRDVLKDEIFNAHFQGRKTITIPNKLERKYGKHVNNVFLTLSQRRNDTTIRFGISNVGQPNQPFSASHSEDRVKHKGGRVVTGMSMYFIP